MPLGDDKFALVDAADFDLVGRYTWSPNANGYPYSTRARGRTLMGRLIMGATRGTWVDHKNGDILDHRRENLRILTMAQNVRNSRKPKARSTNPSRFKGVVWHPQSNKWRVRLCHERTWYQVGMYSDETAAALAYDEKIRELRGEFGRYNFPRDGERSALDIPSVLEEHQQQSA